MPLVLAVHTVPTVTAKVAFSVILLQDFISNSKVPKEFKCRQLIPTSGSRSASLWDASDPDALLAWLTENVSVDCEHEVFEVQEDFGLGLGEVLRARAAERVAAGAKDVYDGASKSVADIDSKLRISERAGHAVEAVRESAVVQGTAKAFSQAGTSVKNATAKVLEQPAVASATEAVGSGFRRLGQGISSLTGRMIHRTSSSGASGGEAGAAAAGAAVDTSHFAGSKHADFEAAATSAAPPAPVTASRAAAEAPPTAPAFTLDDGELVKPK